MKQITITTATGTVTYPLAKGAIPAIKGGVFIIETKDAGTKTIPATTILDSEITDATNAGKLDALRAENDTAAHLLEDATLRVFNAARTSAADDVNDSEFQSALTAFAARRAAKDAAEDAITKYEHVIARNRAAFQRRKAEKASAAAAAAENDGTHAFNADEPIGSPSAPAPITAPEKKTKKTKKS